MAVDATLARGSTIEINTGDEVTPAWVLVEGINQITHSPTTNRADTRTFDDGGRHRHIVASRGDSFTAAGLYKVDEDTGDRAPGQEAVEAAAVEFSQSARTQWRITDPSGENSIVFWGSAEVTRLGGGVDDPQTWSFGVEVDGDIDQNPA